MEENKAMYRYLYDEFEMYYKHSGLEVVDWEPIGKNLIVVTYDNGIRAYYDGFSQTTHTVHPRKDPREFISDDIYIRRFAWRLSSAFAASSLSRDEISERTGISKASLSGYLNGKSMPSVINAYKLARVLRCPVEDLIGVDSWDL